MSIFPTFVTVVVLGCILQGTVIFGCGERDRLVRDLTTSYLTSVEPDKIVLKTGLAPICARYDRTTGELTTNAWEKLTWKDSRLSWKPKDYNGIETIRLPSKLVWVPDFKLYNSLTAVEERDRTNVAVYHDGTVLWVPTVIYRTLCSSEQEGSGLNCQIITGSWTYDSDTLKLELDETGIDLSSYFNSTCPLGVDNASAVIRTKTYPCCVEPYSSVEYNIRFKPQRF